jgi:hypothetical protein
MISTDSLQPVFEYLLAGGAIAIGAAIFAITLRTNSFHVLGSRVWRLAMGTDSAKDEKIRQCLEAETSLSHFRFMFGLNPKSIRETHSIIDWSEEHHINLVDLGRSRDYFNIQDLVMDEKKLPARWKFISLIIVSLLFMAFAFTTGFASLFNRPVFQFDESKTYFSLSESSATTYFEGASKALTKADCKKPVVGAEFGFTQPDAQLLCSFFEDKSAKHFVADILAGQRTVLIALALVFMGCFFWVAMRITAVKTAEGILAAVKEVTLLKQSKSEEEVAG